MLGRQRTLTGNCPKSVVPQPDMVHARSGASCTVGVPTIALRSELLLTSDTNAAFESGKHLRVVQESREPMNLARHSLDFLVFCVSALIFLGIGGYQALHFSGDFMPVYTGAKCLLHGCNPYDPLQLKQQGSQEMNSPSMDTPNYPPSTLLVLSPFALPPFPIARFLWFLLNGGLFVFSAWLILLQCPQSYRGLPTIVVSLILVLSKNLLWLGQPTIFALSLLIIGSYLFVRGRFLSIGAFLLMLSLAVKPQIGGLIVLYLLLSGIHRRYIVMAGAGALGLLLSGGLILSEHAPSSHWKSDLRTNISATLKPGALNDPRPASGHAAEEINLQPVTSVVFSGEQEFNDAAYAIFLVLLAVWIIAFRRAHAEKEMYFLLLASLAVLSLLPIYHRSYDAALLIITVPAVAIVFQKRRFLGAVMAALTVVADAEVQFRVQMFLQRHAMWQNILHNKLLTILLLRQQNLELPLLFGLYMVAIFSIPVTSAPRLEPSPGAIRMAI